MWLDPMQIWTQSCVLSHSATKIKGCNLSNVSCLMFDLESFHSRLRFYKSSNEFPAVYLNSQHVGHSAPYQRGTVYFPQALPGKCFKGRITVSQSIIIILATDTYIGRNDKVLQTVFPICLKKCSAQWQWAPVLSSVPSTWAHQQQLLRFDLNKCFTSHPYFSNLLTP